MGTGYRVYPWWLAAACLLLALATAACGGGGGIDPGGGGGDEKSAEVMQADDDYPDDTLASKNPAYVDYMVVKGSVDYSDVYINRSDSVVSLEIIEPEGGGESTASKKLYRNFAEVYADTSVSYQVLPSIDLVDRYTKSTDDAAYGAVELAYHDGDGIYPGGKQGLLTDILAALLAQPSAAGRDLACAYLGAALTLGGGTPGTTGAIATKQQEIVDRFLQNTNRSKVLGFYTEHPTLGLVFKRDRMLQESCGMTTSSDLLQSTCDTELAAMAAIAAVLDADAPLLEAYDKYQRTAERITNPTSNLDLRDLLPFTDLFGNPSALREALVTSEAWQTKVLDRNASNGANAGVAFWPFSTCKENALFRNIGPGEAHGIDFMEWLITEIKAGNVSLAPAADSGWYDYQTYAIETFLIPEYAYEYQNLMMQGLYKKRLKSAFASLLTQRRETHVKQLEPVFGPTCEPAPPPVPPFSVEPVPTHFLRTARGYTMLTGALAGVMGDEAYLGINLAGGTASMAESLEQTRAVFYGLYLISCCEIGIAPALEADELAGCTALEPPADYADYLNSYPVALEPGISDDAAARRVAACRLAETWLDELAGKTDLLATDSRVIVPVVWDPVYGEWTNWAVIGVKLMKLKAGYEIAPRVVYDSWSDPLTPEEARRRLRESEGLATINWEPLEVFIPVYDFAEVKFARDPMTREEFRAVCDQYDNHDDVVAALEAL